MSFFSLQTPRHMLLKARREFARMQEELDVDHVYNFFVTAYHIYDYAAKATNIPQQELEAFAKDQDICDCRDLCDKSKHLNLTKRPNPETIVYDHLIGGNTPFGTFMFGGSDEWTLLTTDGREVEVVELAERVLTKWEHFLAKHGL